MNTSLISGMSVALAMGMSLLLAGQAVAEEEGWYINGSYHRTELEDADNENRQATTSCVLGVCSTTVTETDFDSDFDDDDHPGFSIGYDSAGPFRVDLEYREHEHDIKGAGVPAGDSSRDTRSLLLNLWRDFQIGSSGFYPYLGGGLGVAEVEQGNVDDYLAMGQVGVGVAWFFTQRLGLDLGYRYFLSEPNPVLESGSRELETDHEGQTVLLGLRYNFFDRRTPSRDTDGDGVVDGSDNCPGTLRNVKVDAVGCPVDSDGDGYADYLDKCPDSAPGARVDDRGCEVIKSFVLEGVNFETNSAVLTAQSRSICESTAAKLETVADKRYEVQGHTDDRGDDAYNTTLSQERANAVRDCLIREGVAADRLEARGYGEERPVAGNDTPQGRAQNRRVQLDQIE